MVNSHVVQTKSVEYKIKDFLVGLQKMLIVLLLLMSRMLLDAGVDVKRLEDVIYMTAKEVDAVAEIRHINYEKKKKKKKKLPAVTRTTAPVQAFSQVPTF